ncbi:cytochrome c oxidase assembly protein [Alishewanella sp. SMS8]|uniref:cytochrome c oxidase assembly protein n=1 Tax=unclassified Alishewanella TaxID=2628974 RepID=UPI0027420800|nr:cytochrome c oxidase assembly protein [Alishewanella sp. SMS8]MDP4945627.1 cytochrome c oxidase assembly protein [Alishewanella sp.]MDP5205545.1 cytochrome c oxidase assembly protein [Alishewanella sp. SMS9]MDP5034986.1 cytochrome c oxidase assembly protein [Alishewanella sp.]MDP5186910.1 cytochrome c oxidase assembly protein [Alishewanella sp.]MDP5460560.1 cytochrome c oxidase assembly protein [Alishewanella sp. SMS8]
MQLHRTLVSKLLLVVLLMFGFGFALVPLYDVFCDITGINGKPSATPATVLANNIDTSREVTIEFLARPNKDMPWIFKPEIRRLTVHPGEIYVMNYIAENPTSRMIVGQAVPSVSPGQAALYLHKIECFCFTQQQLAGGNNMLMPVQFYVDPALPAQFSTITLNYTLYDVTASWQPDTATAKSGE